MIKKLSLLIFVLFCFQINAQQIDVTGTVTDEVTGQPIPGVNILVQNTSKGASTDFDGNYNLLGVEKGSTLIFSYIGYKNVEVILADNSVINVQLQEDTEALDEVIVIGYGTQTKKELTGAVSTVSAETLEEFKPQKVEQALQGTVSGVNVTSQSGAPGAGLDIRIRGIGGNGVNGPTVIIDGYVGDLSILNPADIETITVLKDAQAAIYGTIGANGVILITTKSGRKNQKPKVSYNTYAGFQETSRELPLLNATEYALLLNESYAAGGQPIPFQNVTQLGQGTDWQGETLNTGVPIVNHDFSITGGSEKITYSISGSHLYQQGIIAPEKSDFRRNTARLGLTAELSDKLKVNTNVIYTYLDRDSVNDFGLGSVLFNALNAPPTLSAFDETGELSLIPSTPGLGIEIINPLAQIRDTHNDFDLRKLNGTVGLEFELNDNISFESRIGFNTTSSEGKTFFKEVNYGGKVFDVPRSQVNQNAINDNDYSLDIFANYEKVFAENHDVKVLVGTTIFQEFGNGLFATGFDVPNNSWQFADIALTTGTSEAPDVGSYAYDERRLSFLTRLQYAFKGKYLFSAMLRRDSSTKFGPERRVGYFPSVTAGWVVSDESFMNDSEFINFMKFRASYGVLGNDQIPNNGFVSLLDGEATYVFDNTLINGQATGRIPNPELQWEESKKLDIGLDLRLLDNKLDITVDYFRNIRDNLLIPDIPVSGIVGASAPGAFAPTINAGEVENTGVEFAFNYNHNFSEDFSFNLAYNVTYLQNEVLEVNNSTGFLEGGSFGVGQPAISRMEVGQPIGYFFGYLTDGLFQTQAEVDAHPSQINLGANASPGDLRYVDVNGDGQIDLNDRTNIGDPIPDFTMGLNLNLKFKDFDFVAYTFASIGNDMVRNYERDLTDVNRLNYLLDRWTGPGTSNSVPRVTTAATANNVFSDFFVEDASFVRIQNVQLGYTIPQSFTKKIGIEKLRIYSQVNNLYTFTKYRGYDPGASSGAPIGGGIDFGFYPIPRTYLVGLNLNF
ncbi:MAG: TonB-dependent receptor [Bacteroidota bacterium]